MGSLTLVNNKKVTTYDTHLATGYTRIENKMISTVSGLHFLGGRHYTMRFVLGMTTFKLNVTSTEAWDAAESPVILPLVVTTERGTSASSSLKRRK